MPRKMARSGRPPAVRARGMAAAVGTARRSCGKARKARTFPTKTGFIWGNPASIRWERDMHRHATI